MEKPNLLDIDTAFFFGAFIQNAIVWNGLILGRLLSVLPPNIEAKVFFCIAVLSVLHASSNAIGVYSTNLVGAKIPVYDSDPFISKTHSYLELIGSYTWFLTGIATDYGMAFLTSKKIIFVLISNRLITFDRKKHWFIPFIAGAFLSAPGIVQVVWLYLGVVLKIMPYDDFVAKYLVGVRMIFIKGADMVFLIEVFQSAQYLAWDLKLLLKRIPKTLEALLYYMVSTLLFFGYLSSSNPEVVRLLRNLTNKGTEVASFYHLYYASIFEIQSKDIREAFSKPSKAITSNPNIVSIAMVVQTSDE